MIKPSILEYNCTPRGGVIIARFSNGDAIPYAENNFSERGQYAEYLEKFNNSSVKLPSKYYESLIINLEEEKPVNKNYK